MWKYDTDQSSRCSGGRATWWQRQFVSFGSLTKKLTFLKRLTFSMEIPLNVSTCSMMGYYTCLWSWGWDFYSIRCCYYFEWNHREDNFRSHKQLLSLRNPCGSEYNFHSLVPRQPGSRGKAIDWGDRAWDAMWPRKSINRARQWL